MIEIHIIIDYFQIGLPYNNYNRRHTNVVFSEQCGILQVLNTIMNPDVAIQGLPCLRQQGGEDSDALSSDPDEIPTAESQRFNRQLSKYLSQDDQDKINANEGNTEMIAALREFVIDHRSEFHCALLEDGRDQTNYSDISRLMVVDEVSPVDSESVQGTVPGAQGTQDAGILTIGSQNAGAAILAFHFYVASFDEVQQQGTRGHLDGKEATNHVSDHPMDKVVECLGQEEWVINQTHQMSLLDYVIRQKRW